MGGGGLLAAGSALAVVAVIVLRYSWGRPGRSGALNALGWALIAAAVAVGCALAGAWGIAVVSLWAMGAACAILGWEAWQSPRGRERASSRRAHVMPDGRAPLHLGRRLLTFALVVLAGFAAAVCFAIGVRWGAAALGASEADANVLALLASPIAWTVIVFMLLMTARRRRQLAILAIAAAPALTTFI